LTKKTVWIDSYEKNFSSPEKSRVVWIDLYEKKSFVKINFGVAVIKLLSTTHILFGN